MILNDSLENILKDVKRAKDVSDIQIHKGNGDRGAIFKGMVSFSFVLNKERWACYESEGKTIMGKEVDYNKFKHCLNT